MRETIINALSAATFIKNKTLVMNPHDVHDLDLIEFESGAIVRLYETCPRGKLYILNEDDFKPEGMNCKETIRLKPAKK